MQRVDPTAGVRVLLQRDDIMANFVGEALLVSPCRAVNVTHIYWSYERDDKCYEYIPVDTHDGDMFLLPGTKELVLRSLEVECSQRKFGAHEQGPIWITDQGAVNVRPIPLVQNYWQSNQPFSLYPRQAVSYEAYVSQTAFSVQQLRSIGMRQQLLASALERLINYTAEFATNPDEAKTVLRGLSSVSGSIFDDALRFTGMLGTNAQEYNSARLVHGLVNGNSQLAIGIILITLILVLLIVLGIKFRLRTCPFFLRESTLPKK
jgi:hypothetical protein